MNSVLLLSTVLYAALCLMPCTAHADLHLAPNGNHANTGTRDAPFATLERARDAARELRQNGEPVTVWLHGGVYRRDATFELTEQDSGTAGAPVVYRAVEGEEVRLVGGPAITPEAFGPVTDETILKRLDESARGNVLQADLKALGVTDFGKPFPVKFRGYAGWPELFFDREPMRLARWPNEGLAKVAKVVDQGSRPRWNEKPDRPGVFEYEGDLPARWLTADEVYLDGYWCFKWFDECIRVDKIDPEAKRITFAAPHVYGLNKDGSGGFYFALNLLEELDSPGEYYVDRKTGVLYFWPPAPVAGKEIGLSLLDAPMVSLEGTSHVTFRDLTFEFSRGVPITMSGGSHNLIAGCTIRNLATDAIKVNGGTDNGVLSCDLYNLGGAGISLNGGDRATLTPCRNFAENNHLHHFGRIFRTHKDALYLNGVGCRASHNLIHDAPHHALDFGGNEHLIELNEIHDVCTETDDAGALYTGRDWTVRGTVIKHNFFHAIGGHAHVGDQAIYVDDTACGITSVGNVIYRVYRAFLIGGGRDNVMDNNVIVECPLPMHIDNRGMSWSGKGTENWTTLTTRLAAVPYQKEPWRSRYPELANILDDEPGLPKRNRVTRNLMVNCGKMNLAKEAQEHGTIENNWETKEDPGFLDAASLNFALKDDSPAFQQIPGFEKIPFDEIGLYVDEFRKVLPVKRPSLTPAASAFVEELTVRLVPNSRSPKCRVHYTLDGSEPTEASPVCTGPLTLTETTTIKAVAYASAGGETECSETVTATYPAQRLGPDGGVYLSDLPEADAFVHGGLKKDVNYSGKGQVALAGTPFAKSLMIHAETAEGGGRSHVTYALEGGLQKAKRFTATIGIDDEAGNAGSCTFAVEVFRGGKWERVFESGVLRGGGEPEEVDVDIAGAERIRLCVHGRGGQPQLGPFSVGGGGGSVGRRANSEHRAMNIERRTTSLERTTTRVHCTRVL